MAQKVAHLTSFIKPAAPNDTVLNKIKDNTTKWMNQNLTALKKNDTSAKEVLLDYAGIRLDLSTGLGPFNNEAYDRALRRAHQATAGD